MLIEDIRPPRKPTATVALQKVQQLHNASKLSNLSKSRPRSFDILPSKPLSTRPGPHLTDIQPQRNHPTAVQAPQPATKPSFTHVPSPIVVPTPTPRPASIPTKATARPPLWRRLADFAQYPLIAIFAILAAYNSTAGQIMIGLYGILTIVFRINSQYTFGAALILLIGIPSFQALHQSGVSEKCAIYAYELLVVGTLQAIVETWLENRSTKLFQSVKRS